jgi:hypothetical protein
LPPERVIVTVIAPRSLVAAEAEATAAGEEEIEAGEAPAEGEEAAEA